MKKWRWSSFNDYTKKGLSGLMDIWSVIYNKKHEFMMNTKMKSQRACLGRTWKDRWFSVEVQAEIIIHQQGQHWVRRWIKGHIVFSVLHPPPFPHTGAWIRCLTLKQQAAGVCSGSQTESLVYERVGSLSQMETGIELFLFIKVVGFFEACFLCFYFVGKEMNN